MAGIALNGQGDLVSIMVPPAVLLKENFLEKKKGKCKNDENKIQGCECNPILFEILEEQITFE